MKENFVEASDWTRDVEAKLKRKNEILFSRKSECLQELLALIREKKHRTLVLWAFACAEVPLQRLKERCPNEERPARSVRLCRQWEAGEVKMPTAKKALLEAHAAAKEVEGAENAALCHAVGQACAVVHVETHAIGLPFYERTAIVRERRGKDYRAAVEKRIEEYIDCLKDCAARIESVGFSWAEFLLDDRRPNKEKELFRKERTV